jgi:LacI family transcriptional regulator
MERPFRRVFLMIGTEWQYFRSIILGVMAYAQPTRRWIFLAGAESPDSLAAVRNWNASGVIAVAWTPEIVQSLRKLKIPVINISGVLPNTGLPRVGPDDYAVGRMGAEHLLERGFRTFAFIGHKDHGYSQRRRAGFSEALKETGFECIVVNRDDLAGKKLVERNMGVNAGVLTWVQKLPKPIAVMGCNDIRAKEIGRVCQVAGLRVPEDVAILGVDNDEVLCRLAHPPLSSISQGGERIGFEAAALLERLMNGEPRPQKPILLPPEKVVVRASTDTIAIADREISTVVKYIREHPDHDISVTDLLKIVPLCRSTLERRFKRVVGHSLNKEIRRSHLARARQLLAETDYSLQEIAGYSGFATPQWMAMVFRKELNTTPTEYRDRFRKRR